MRSHMPTAEERQCILAHTNRERDRDYSIEQLERALAKTGGDVYSLPPKWLLPVSWSDMPPFTWEPSRDVCGGAPGSIQSLTRGKWS